MPKTPVDLALAPVAVGIDINLKRIRDASPKDIVEEIIMSLNTEPGGTRDQRAKQVLEVATRLVELHGWTAAISDDATRVELRGGTVDLDVGLSAGLRDYIELGPL